MSNCQACRKECRKCRKCECECECKHHKCRCPERCYETFNYPCSAANEKTLLTGVRGVNCTKDEVYMSGFYVPTDATETTAFVYKGCLCGCGKFHDLNFPEMNGTPTITNLYGPNNGDEEDTIRVVGNYTLATQNGAIGCMYEGNLDNSGEWTTITPPFGAVLNTICHSTMGDLVVGNYDTVLIQGKAFIYDVKTHRYFDIVNDDAISITAYGIWHNECDSYTICGGYTTCEPDNVAYMVDWDNKCHELTNWRTYHYNNDECQAKVTHFDGITLEPSGSKLIANQRLGITGGSNKDIYNLTGVWLGKGNLTNQAFFAKVKRGCNGKFIKKAKWCPIGVPHKILTTGNTVYKDVVIGVYTDIQNSTINGYVATVVKNCM